MTLYCKYCNEEIEGKGYKADGERYHLKCVRKFRKEIEKQKNQGRIKPGQENKVAVNKYIKDQY
jgi:hypothetical protein